MRKLTHTPAEDVLEIFMRWYDRDPRCSRPTGQWIVESCSATPRNALTAALTHSPKGLATKAR